MEFAKSYIRYFIKVVANNNEITSLTDQFIEILTDAAIERLFELASDVMFLAERAGRSEPSGSDVMNALRKYDQTSLSLASYVANDSPKTEITASDFPLPHQMEESVPLEILPYRSNGYVDYTSGRTICLPHVPIFFPLPFEKNIEESEMLPLEKLMNRPNYNEKLFSQLEEPTLQQTHAELTLFCPLAKDLYEYFANPKPSE